MPPLAVFVQAGGPIFTNDLAGTLRVLGMIASIVLTIGTFIWFLANRQERQDINAIGGKVDGIQKQMITDRALVEQLKEERFEDRLALMSELTALRVAVGRIEERTCTGVEMKDAIIEGVKIAAMEFRRATREGDR